MAEKPVVKIRNLAIGEGRPKICAPIVGKTEAEILASAEKVKLAKADMAEWRVDFLEEIEDMERVKAILADLRASLGNMPLLFTFRSLREGGEKAITKEQYALLNQTIAITGNVDLIDLELFDENVETLVKEIHRSNVKVILSNHDFHKTPENKELKHRFYKMKEYGADIVKIAVMPQNAKDVLRLLAVTEEMNCSDIGCPVVSMSMSGIGLISRIAGEVFGSAVTFGAVGKVSAPGQIEVVELSTILTVLHDHMK